MGELVPKRRVELLRGEGLELLPYSHELYQQVPSGISVVGIYILQQDRLDVGHIRQLWGRGNTRFYEGEGPFLVTATRGNQGLIDLVICPVAEAIANHKYRDMITGKLFWKTLKRIPSGRTIMGQIDFLA